MNESRKGGRKVALQLDDRWYGWIDAMRKVRIQSLAIFLVHEEKEE